IGRFTLVAEGLPAAVSHLGGAARDAQGHAATGNLVQRRGLFGEVKRVFVAHVDDTVPTSMCLVVAATAPSSGIGAEACGSKSWQLTVALFMSISSAAWSISRLVLAIFSADGPCWSSKALCPKLKNPNAFIG